MRREKALSERRAGEAGQGVDTSARAAGMTNLAASTRCEIRREVRRAWRRGVHTARTPSSQTRFGPRAAAHGSQRLAGESSGKRERRAGAAGALDGLSRKADTLEERKREGVVERRGYRSGAAWGQGAQAQAQAAV